VTIEHEKQNKSKIPTKFCSTLRTGITHCEIHTGGEGQSLICAIRPTLLPFRVLKSVSQSLKGEKQEELTLLLQNMASLQPSVRATVIALK